TASPARLPLPVLVLATRSSPPTRDLAALPNATLHGAYTGLVFWLFFLGFALLLPVVPLHTWLVDAVAEASPPVAALIGGAIPVLGGYGLYRTLLGESPADLHSIRGAVLALSLATL